MKNGDLILLWFLLMKFCSRDVKRAREKDTGEFSQYMKGASCELERGVTGFGTIND